MATRPCYTFHSSFSYLYYHILSYYMLLSHILHIHLYILILSYTLCFRLLFVLFLYWFKANTSISHLYFSYSVNFYLIFPISRRSIRLILLLSYHILSYVFMCFHILYFSYIFLFSLLLYFTCSYPFRVLRFVLSIYCIHILFIYYFNIPIFMYCSCTIFIYLYSCTVHFIYCFPVILFI